jgi:putative SOS response-associated peptidase YedK
LLALYHSGLPCGTVFTDMCANYIPVTSAERLLQFFGVIRDVDEPARDVFPAGLAPFIRLAPDGTDSGELIRTVADGIFRFVPDFVAKVDWARHTYNARAETVDTKTTYKKAWASGHRCIIPTEAISRALTAATWGLTAERCSRFRWSP